MVAAPKRAMSERTETWPMNVAMASKTNTTYTYGCCLINKNDNLTLGTMCAFLSG